MEVKEELRNCLRVLKVNKKPSREELRRTLRICVIGVLLLGSLGFLFYAISVVLGL